MSGRSTAREIIQSIVKSHGFVSEESLLWMGSMRPEVRREVEEALLVKDKKIGSSVLTLAKNLYTSEARFIFELLQNAEDNQYTVATGQNVVPYVSFKLFSDRIVVECNEDGFTRNHLHAICDVGQSSKNGKSGSHGYVGEKGIGFKSVFMAAWKVHIQSGDFSFCFFHRKGDSGMGMIMPIWEEPEADLPRPLTRITLFLHEDTSQREFIETQLRELQDTFLLFLTKLRRIDIAFHDSKGQQTVSTSLNKVEESNRVILSNVSTGPSPNDSVRKSQTYHVTSHTVRNLPRSNNREYSPKEESDRAWASSTVVLAFPLTESAEPIIAPQDIFAFLPVTCKGFKFIIQADFDTLANRQDILTTSKRNEALLAGIADAFVEAVLQFCEHETLQYHWMRYVPIEYSYPWDSFWRKLVNAIEMQLKVESVLRSRTRNRLNRISDLKRRPSETNDGEGEPLFADLPSELYLSDRYEARDLVILEKFGLGAIMMDEIIQLLKHDLSLDRVNMSKMKGKFTSKEWHSRAALLLQCRGQQDRPRSLQTLRQLELIPLKDGRWVPATIGPIYFPITDDKAPIPGGLDLMLVHPDAASNENRGYLFRLLGVTTATAGTIRAKILATYGTRDGVELASKITRDISTEHWRFLYLTQHAASTKESLSSVRIWDHAKRFDPVGNFDYYLPDHSANGPQTILGQEMEGLNIYLIDTCYLKDPPGPLDGSTLTWTQWLHNCAGIRRHLRLVNKAKDGLSEECRSISKKRPEKFLGWLKSVWPDEGHLVCANAAIRDPLMLVTHVRCLGPDRKTDCLKYSWLPAPDLRAACHRFLGDSFFPFLALPSGEDDDNLGRWSFLTKELGVGMKDGLKFRLAMLRYFNLAHKEITCKSIMILLTRLYNYIEASWLERQDSASCEEEIRGFFEVYNLLLLPSPDGSKATWTRHNICLWDAPGDMTTKKSLQVLYTAAFANTDVDLERLSRFFSNVLRIRDISCDDIIMELRSKKRRESEASPAAIQSLYGRLHGVIADKNDDMLESLRQTMESEALLYVLQNNRSSWLKPSECLWSTTTQIHGKVAINFQYKGLKSLFVDKLLVKTVDVDMVYQELLGVPSRQPPATVSEVKELLMTLNSFLSSGAHPPPPNKLLQEKIFPVKWPQGKVELASAQLEFAVVDREGSFDVFRDRVKTLDFSLQEVCRLRPFIAWSGLEERCLSKTVMEVSRIEGRESHAISPTRDIKKKAYGLLRIAASYNSPMFDDDAEGLYDLLRSALTVETEKISARLALEQDKEIHEIELSNSDLHIDGDDGELKIYVLKNEVAQDACFKSRLPRRLAHWLIGNSRVEDSLVQAINAVLDCRIESMHRILEIEGIPGIDIADQSVNDIPISVAEQVATLQYNIPRTPERSLSPEVARRLDMSGGDTPSSTSSVGAPTTYDTPLTDVDENYFPAVQSTPTNRILRFRPVSTAADAQYRKMLDTAVSVARAAEFPEHDETGPFGMARMLSTLPSPEDDSIEPIPPFGRTDFEGRAMIGAVGELFVFELLSNLERKLEGFCLENWQSTIRTHVNAHPDYADLSRWSGRETSDIVYDDVSGTFTNLLIKKGYLPEKVYLPEYHWENKSPRYFIEVKSTTGQCATPFFMSSGQYERMQKLTNSPIWEGKQSEVYVIFRVYNLGKPNMAVKVYVDPERLRSDKTLRFTTDKWTVVPSVPPEAPFP